MTHQSPGDLGKIQAEIFGADADPAVLRPSGRPPSRLAAGIQDASPTGPRFLVAIGLTTVFVVAWIWIGAGGRTKETGTTEPPPDNISVPAVVATLPPEPTPTVSP